MSELITSGQMAAQAKKTSGLFVCPDDRENLNSFFYTVEVKDAQGVAFLRRLLTIDVKNIHRGEVRQSFILNALGLITDFVWVAHLPDSDDHYRVIFQSLDTLAWMHQVAKAFDEDFTQIETTSALLFTEQSDSPHGSLTDGKVQTMKTGKGEILLMRVGQMSLLQGPAEAFAGFNHPGIEKLDELAALTLSYTAARPLSFGWQASDLMPPDLDGAHFIDFSDPSRMFIGRALTEARLKAQPSKKAVVLVSHQDDPQSWFENPVEVNLLTEKGEVVAKTAFVGLLGDKLIGVFFIDESLDPEKLLWVSEGSSDGYRVEVLQ